jgi:hypothetical protein
MNHTEAKRSMAVEKYLLDEFDPEERDAFEEHFFSCDDCAEDVRAGSALMKHGREIFAQEKATQVRAVVPIKVPRREWFNWLRPAFAVPIFALMLGVVVFQNLVQLPALEHSLVALNSPAILPNADLHSGSARGEDHVVTAKPGQLFQLTLDIPDNSNAAHTAELYDAGGRKMWSLPIAANAPLSGVTLKMPGDLAAGNYTLAVSRQDAGGASEVSRYAFTLRRD